MNINIPIKDLIAKFKWRNIRRLFASILAKGIRWFPLILLIVLCSYGGYLWYSYVYQAHWSDTRKQSYISDKDKGTIFDRAKFDAVVSEMERTENDYGNNPDNLSDIFKLKETVVKQ